MISDEPTPEDIERARLLVALRDRIAAQNETLIRAVGMLLDEIARLRAERRERELVP